MYIKWRLLAGGLAFLSLIYLQIDAYKSWSVQAAQADWSVVVRFQQDYQVTVSCPDSEYCWAVGYAGHSAHNRRYRTRDGAYTWQEWKIPGVFPAVTTVAFYDRSLGYASNDPSAIGAGWIAKPEDYGLFRTKDGGATWERVSNIPAYAIFVINSQVAYFRDSPLHNVYKTSDSGDTWELWTRSDIRSDNTVFLDENIAWFVSGAISYTTDGWRTSTWIKPGDRRSNYLSISFVDYWNGWASGWVEPQRNPILARTRDAGQTWQIFSTPAYFNSLYFSSPEEGWATAYRGTLDNQVYRTKDGGGTWELDATLPAPARLVTFHDPETGWAVGVGNGNVLKRSPGIALTPTPTPTLTPGPEARQNVIPRLYWEVLCRGIDPQGYQYWLNSPLTTEQIRQELINSPEGQRVVAVRALYTAILARDPMHSDCGGLRSWVDSSLSLAQVQASLEASGEGQRVAAVRQLYIELLGRDPLGSDNAGLRYWVQLPLPISDIRRLIMESEEYRRTHGG